MAKKKTHALFLDANKIKFTENYFSIGTDCWYDINELYILDYFRNESRAKKNTIKAILKSPKRKNFIWDQFQKLYPILYYNSSPELRMKLSRYKEDTIIRPDDDKAVIAELEMRLEDATAGARNSSERGRLAAVGRARAADERYDEYYDSAAAQKAKHPDWSVSRIADEVMKRSGKPLGVKKATLRKRLSRHFRNTSK